MDKHLMKILLLNEIYAYIDEISTIKEEKAIHLIYILAELENRTTS